jgi:transposase-like protein
MTKQLRDIKKIFPSEHSCIEFLENVFWGGNPVCPYCSNTNKQYMISKLGDRYHCNSCNSSFSVTVKTIFSRTRCDLRKWFFAIYLLYSPNNKIPVRELADKIETTKDTA